MVMGKVMAFLGYFIRITTVTGKGNEWGGEGRREWY
jgi:hypothetical protein